ncbi:polypeptide N-acetylgalactosaminyltransferase 14-like [Mya arenaria]|uniref:polypeptide N-acetylgalactosaminyltransferase 14-like n=1 Tax=Mya arenaria TaxID=6604 RepID=UPI0022E89F82|nr:polypeptide N-acetylgalactosaminyltransferase 14-like [Mya arenaria]
MKIWQRYVLFMTLASCLTVYVTFFIYKHVKLKYSSKILGGRRGVFSDAMTFNRNPNAIFYDLYEHSPLYNILKDVDRSTLTDYRTEEVLDSDLVTESQRKHGINVALSDLLPLNRPVPDSRPSGCRYLKYPEADLPTVSVVIPFHNEWPSVLLRTVHSLVSRTPSRLLKQIILVDDNSNLPGLQAHLEEQLRRQFPGPLVELRRLQVRTGLIGARLEGLKYVTADTVSFFDSHMEVNENWLPPLLSEVLKDRRTVAMAQLDYVNKDSLEYEFTDGYRTRYGFDWRLVFFETYFRDDHIEGTSDTDPLPGVVMVGPGAVMNVQYFRELGSYDDGMMIWGGENLEFPWRVWLCGGRMLHVPCSRIGHIARSQPYHFPHGRLETEHRNYKRAIEVWMDDYKQYVYEANPAIKHAEAGDLTERLELKARLKCRPFSWLLENVWPDLLVYKENTLAWGWLKCSADGQELCIDNSEYLFSVSHPLVAKSCTYKLKPEEYAQHLTATHQTMALTKERRLRTLLQCVAVEGHFLSDRVPVMVGCFDREPETWTHTGPGLLQHDKSELCLEIGKRGTLRMSSCDTENPRQRWVFAHYNPAGNKRAEPPKLQHRIE